MPRYKLPSDVEDIINRAAGHKISFDSQGNINLNRGCVSQVIRQLQSDLKTAKETLEKDGNQWMPVRHASWEKGFRNRRFNIHMCSNCNHEFIDSQKFRYCPFCGARMDGR